MRRKLRRTAGLGSFASSLLEGCHGAGPQGSRRIVVDGRAYRWRLRGRPTYSEGLAWSPCTFAVEHADNPGTTLVVTTNQPHPSNWIGREAEPALPSGVAAAVRFALRAGWTPTAPGSAFRLDQSAGFTPGY